MALKRAEPATIVVRVRVNHKTMATLANYYDQQGLKPTSKGGLLRSSLELLAENLSFNRKARTYSFTEAVNYLQRLGLVKSSAEDLNRASFMTEMQREALEADGFSTSYLDRKSKDTISKDQMAKATELLNKKLNKNKEEGGAILGATPGEVKDGTERSGNSETDGEDG